MDEFRVPPYPLPPSGMIIPLTKGTGLGIMLLHGSKYYFRFGFCGAAFFTIR
jgi:hypothetical protein